MSEEIKTPLSRSAQTNPQFADLIQQALITRPDLERDIRGPIMVMFCKAMNEKYGLIDGPCAAAFAEEMVISINESIRKVLADEAFANVLRQQRVN